MADDAELSAILRGLGSEASGESGASVPAPMPDDVWTRLQGVLAAEAARRSPEEAAPALPTATAVVAGTDDLAARRGARQRHSRRWATGLVAASAVILAGVVVTSVTNSSDPIPMADGSTAAMAMAQPEAITGAGLLLPPAQRITTSQQDYSMAGLGSQVTDLIAAAGVEPPGVALPQVRSASPTAEAVSGTGVGAMVLAPMERLRECVTKLAHSGDATALVVDLSTFNGQPAGIVVLESPNRQKIIVDIVTVDCVPAIIAEIPTAAQPGMTPRLLP